MTDTPHLLAIIAHGKPVFEIGYQIECPLCTQEKLYCVCPECDGEGHWWITNTGWRARPYWSKDLYECINTMDGLPGEFFDPPDDHPDHFQSYIDRTPKGLGSRLLESLGLGKLSTPITRRDVK